MTARLILASSSPRRLQLLRQIGREPAEVISADVDETPLPGELPRALASRLALAKLRAAMASRPGLVIITGDTVVACGRRILPKAETAEEARDCLQLLSGRRHRVYGGIAVCDPAGKIRQRLVVTAVKFKSLTTAEIDAYIASNEWQGKAGGYGFQGRAAAFTVWINGSYSNIIGLCVYTADGLLSSIGA